MTLTIRGEGNLLRQTIFFGALALWFVSPALSSTIPIVDSSQPIRVRVRLAEALPKASIRGFDLRIFDSRSGTVAANRKPLDDRTAEWDFRCDQGRIRAIRRQGGRALDLKEPVTAESPSGFLALDNKPYRDSIRIYSVGSLCEVVNDVDVEKYLDGLVNAEFSAKWPEEAVAAQVIAARTYAIYQMSEARKDPKSHYDVDATERDQVYDGSIKEDYRASRSVQRTKGLILGTEIGGKRLIPLKAFYHSSCGGVTELPEHVWGRSFPGFKRSVRCPFCVRSPSFSWSLDLTNRELGEKLSSGVLADGSLPGWPANWRATVKERKLTGVKILGYNHEGRVRELAATWKSGAKTVELKFSAIRFRSWLGTTKIKSTSFSIAEQTTALGSRWHIDGRGHGHGVGMCQWGAKVMGEKGYKMASILKHYYPDAKLFKAW
jgi:stage II sporulation protein D